MVLNKVAILIPYRSDNGHRDKICNWVKLFYQKTMPQVEVCIGGSSKGLFSRSHAINQAAKLSTRPIYVIADADIVYDTDNLTQSIQWLKQCPIVFPYQKILNITKQDTEMLLQSTPEWPIKVKVNTSINPYETFGGLTVIKRKTFEAVGGFDERFIGWGGEDDAFRLSITTLFGPYKRVAKNAYHLWHPIVGSQGNPNYKNNYNLTQKYIRAIRNKTAMKQILRKKPKL